MLYCVQVAVVAEGELEGAGEDLAVEAVLVAEGDVVVTGEVSEEAAGVAGSEGVAEVEVGDGADSKLVAQFRVVLSLAHTAVFWEYSCC